MKIRQSGWCIRLGCAFCWVVHTKERRATLKPEKMNEDAKLVEKTIERYPSSLLSECPSLAGERTEIVQQIKDYKDQFHYDEYFDFSLDSNAFAK